MSVPTSEIPQERQDRVRGLFDAGVWGRLPGPIQDRLIREVDRGGDSPAVVEGYQGLIVVSFASLPESNQGQLLDVLRLRPNIDHGTALGFLCDVLQQVSPPANVRDRAVAVAALPTQTQGYSDRDDRLMLRAHYLENQPDRVGLVMDAMRVDGFRSASAADQIRVLDIVEVANPRLVYDRFLFLLNEHRGNPPPSWSRRREGAADMFLRDLRDQGTTLDHLHRLATSQLDSRVEVAEHHRVINDRDAEGNPRSRDYVFRDRSILADLAGFQAQHSRSIALSDLIQEAGSPYQSINQDNRGTCVLTTFLQRVANYCPAEYTRLAVDLLLTGQSTLQDGSTYQPPSDAFANDDSNRSVSERLTQSALARYWAGGALTARGQPRDDLYHNVSPQSRPGVVQGGRAQDGFSGTYSRPQDTRDAERTLRALFGIQYRGVGGPHLMTRLRNELSTHPGTPVFVCMNWGRSAHCVDVRRIMDGPPERVGYWNPWGAQTRAVLNGSPVTWNEVGADNTEEAAGRGGPARRIESQEFGYQSMLLSDFARLVYILYVP